MNDLSAGVFDQMRRVFFSAFFFSLQNLYFVAIAFVHSVNFSCGRLKKKVDLLFIRLSLFAFSSNKKEVQMRNEKSRWYMRPKKKWENRHEQQH